MGYFLSRTICALIFAQVLFFGNTLFAQFLVPTNGPEGGYVKEIVESQSGEIYILTNGVYRLNPDGQSWERLSQQPGSTSYQTELRIGPDGRLYTWDNVRIWQSNPEVTEWTRCENESNGVFSLNFVVDHLGRIIICGYSIYSADMETISAVAWSDDQGTSWHLADTTGFQHNAELRPLTVDELGQVWTSVYYGSSPERGYTIYRSNPDLTEWEAVSILGDHSPWVQDLFTGDGCVFANTRYEVFRYDLAEEAWTQIESAMPGDTLRIISVAADGTVYSCQGDGTYLSEDNGASWTLLSNYRPGYYSTIFESSDQERYLGTGLTIYRFNDQSETWDPLGNGIYTLWTYNTEITGSGDILVRARETHDEQIYEYTYRSPDLGETWEHDFLDKGIVSVIQGNPEILFAAAFDTLYRSDDGGVNWTIVFTEYIAEIVETARGRFIAAGDAVYFSDDRGLTWHESSEGLQVPGDSYRVREIVTTGNAILILLSYTNMYDFFVASSSDDGLTWNLCENLPTDLWFTYLWADFSGSFYIGSLTSEADYFARSEDGGETWTELAGLPVNNLIQFPRALIATGEGILYAQGVSSPALYMSANRGDSWTIIQNSVPDINEFCLTSDGYLIAGMEKNSVWRSSESVLPVNSETNPLPTEFTLYQNYPNPFNSATTFAFDLPMTGPVTMQVFDITGRLTATPISGNLTAGHHSINWDANSLASGVYFYRLETGLQQQAKKLILVK